MQTLAQLVTHYGVDVHPYLDRDDLVPLLDGPQAQGDVTILPLPASSFLGSSSPIPPGGIEVVRGENGGHAHTLLSGDGATWGSASGGFALSGSELKQIGILYDGSINLDLGVLTVPAGSTAHLAHLEHGYLGIAPGTYLLRRTREQADEIVQVRD